MRSGAWFWGAVLILIGVLFLLGNIGLIRMGFDVIGALFLVALGVWFLYGALVKKNTPEATVMSVPLDGASIASLKLQHGAGRLRLRGGAASGDLLSGEFGGGVERQVDRRGDRLDVELRLPSEAWLEFVPFGARGRGSFDWELLLNENVALELSLETGAGTTELDLSTLGVTDLQIQTGASSTEVVLPARVERHSATLKSGVASTKVRVPSGVAARIHTSGGLSDIHVDTVRFPKVGDRYESPDFERAEHRVELRIETGVGSIEVR